MRKYILVHRLITGGTFNVDISTDNRDPEVIYKSVLEKLLWAPEETVCFLLKIDKNGVIIYTQKLYGV